MGPLQILVSLSEPELLQCPDYTQKEAGWQKEKMSSRTQMNGSFLQNGRPQFTAALRRKVVVKLYQATHWGASKTVELLRPIYYIP